MPWNTTKTATTKNLIWRNISWGICESFWRWFSRFLSSPLTLCCNSSTRYPELVKSLFPTSRSFFALTVWSLSGIYWRTQFLSYCSSSNSFLVFFILSLYVESTLSLLGPLYLCTTISSYFGSPTFNFVFCVSLPKIQKSYLLSHLRKNHYETYYIWKMKSEHTKFRLMDHSKFHRTMV